MGLSSIGCAHAHPTTVPPPPGIDNCSPATPDSSAFYHKASTHGPRFFERLNRQIEKDSYSFEILKEGAPGGPIIILLYDSHGTPEPEQAKLKYLRSNFGIDLVGLEGIIYNPPPDIPPNLSRGEVTLDNNCYTTVGLGDWNLENPALKKEFALTYIGYFFNHKNVEFLKSKEGNMTDFERLDLKLSEASMQVSLGNMNGMLYNYGIDPYKDTDQDKFKEFVGNALATIDLTRSDLEKKDGESEEQYLKRLESISDQANSTFREAHENDVYRNRNIVATNAFAQALTSQSPPVGVIIFGALHFTRPNTIPDDNLTEALHRKMPTATIVRFKSLFEIQ